MASGMIPGEFWSPCTHCYEKQVKQGCKFLNYKEVKQERLAAIKREEHINRRVYTCAK